MFVTFEGLDGSGKSTQIQMLDRRLRNQGQDVVVVREPGGTVVGDAVRDLLFDERYAGMGARTQALLFNASRAQLVDDVLSPALEAGKVVLCDRYIHSTVAYQGYGQQQDVETLWDVLHYASRQLYPDLMIYLNMPVEGALMRKMQSEDWNHLDARSSDFYRRVEAGYREMIDSDPFWWNVIDANRPAVEVHQDVMEAFMRANEQREEGDDG